MYGRVVYILVPAKMSYLVPSSIILVFLVMAGLMFTRRISALLALPVMAMAIAIMGGIPGGEILDVVLSKGSLMLHNAYTTTMFGAILAELMNRHGIARALVRWVAEFAGDNPYVLGIVLSAVTALLFTTLGGLGAVIMIGTIVLPVMLSIGIPPVSAGGLFLFAISIGGMFNLANWQLYIEVLALEQAGIIGFVIPFAFILGVLILVFLAIELRSWRNVKFVALGVVLSGLLFFLLYQGFEPSALGRATGPAAWSLPLAGASLLILSLVAFYRGVRRSSALTIFAMLTPIVPLALVLICQWPILPSFIAAIVYGVLITWRKDSVSLLTRSIIDGINSVIPAIFLMIGIGMLIAAVGHEKISGEITPLIAGIVPANPIPYVVLFSLAAPLSLYRGPLSLWGMGSGLVKLVLETGRLQSNAIMGMLMSVGQIQGICDPTNTHNIWIATYLGTDTHALLKRTIPYAWLAAVLGLVLSCYLGYV